MKDTCYIGLDINSRSPYYSALAIDTKLTPLFELSGNWEELLGSLKEYERIIVAINTPTMVNKGFLTQSHIKKHKPGKWPDVRRIEYELEEYGAPIYHTPKKKSNLLAVQQHGFLLIQNLVEAGFKQYGEASEKVFLEVPAETAFWSLETKPLYAADSFIGQIQRQLMLLELGINLPDPMDFFEEITRFKLLTGKVSLEMILETPRLNTWINAYTALLIEQNPSRVARFGYPQEGFLYLPSHLPDWDISESSLQDSLF
jgi:hypothetical protein